jgi:outer membrane murein-binding lipoprotein Lpp
MFRSKINALSFSAAVVSFAALAGTASAQTTWQKDHPARTEINQRLNKQNARIHQDVKNGTLTKSQAESLHHEDNQVRQEERDMASQNGTHLTKQEVGTLNSQENAISKQIPPK